MGAAAMASSTVAQLKAEYTDKYVQADAKVPELTRFSGLAGRVVTVNENGNALVDFEDGPWYDIPLKHLTVVPKPAPRKTAEAHEKKPAPKPKAEAGDASAPEAGEAKPKVAPKPKVVPKPKADAAPAAAPEPAAE
jgi:hypothetical protein